MGIRCRLIVIIIPHKCITMIQAVSKYPWVKAIGSAEAEACSE